MRLSMDVTPSILSNANIVELFLTGSRTIGERRPKEMDTDDRRKLPETDHIEEVDLYRHLRYNTPLEPTQQSHLDGCAECTELRGTLEKLRPYIDRAQDTNPDEK